MIARIEEIFRAWCDSCGIAWESQWAGKHVVLLQVEQRVRVLREVEGASLTLLGKEEIIVALETVMGPDRDEVAELYERLEDWRTVKFIPEGYVSESDTSVSSPDGSPSVSHPPGPYTPLPGPEG